MKGNPHRNPNGTFARADDVDPAVVSALAAVGCTAEEIAAVTGCERTTLWRRFEAEIETGHIKMRASLRRRQFKLAMEGNTAMLIFLGKQYLGQMDQVRIDGNIRHEHREADDEAILAAADEVKARRAALPAL